jgi:hypothetical protein
VSEIWRKFGIFPKWALWMRHLVWEGVHIFIIMALYHHKVPDLNWASSTMTSPLSLFAYLQINWNGKPVFVFKAFLVWKSKVVKLHLISGEPVSKNKKSTSVAINLSGIGTESLLTEHRSSRAKSLSLTVDFVNFKWGLSIMTWTIGQVGSIWVLSVQLTSVNWTSLVF